MLVHPVDCTVQTLPLVVHVYSQEGERAKPVWIPAFEVVVFGAGQVFIGAILY